MTKTTFTLLALVLTILVATTTTLEASSVKVPALPNCVRYYSGIGESCNEEAATPTSVCMGDAFCAEEVCRPKQIFVGDKCSDHYECFRGFEHGTDAQVDDRVLSSFGVYCDLTCKFTKENGETCSRDYECQSNRCISGVCSLVKQGASCLKNGDCLPFDGELFACYNKTCTAKSPIGGTCLSDDQCTQGAFCGIDTGTCKAYRTENQECTVTVIEGSPCAPSFDGSDNELICNDRVTPHVCTYVAQLRERYADSHCINKYSEYENLNSFGTCDKKSCYSDEHYNCDDNSEFCDCTNNVCMSKSHGNQVHACDFDQGFRSERTNAFTRCLKEKCPNTVFSTGAIMLNRKSCAYTSCNKEYMDVVKCRRDAGKEYGTTRLHYFGAGTGAGSQLSQLSPVIAALLVIVNIAYAML